MRADNGWSASTWVGRPATVISVPTNCAGPGAVRVEFDVDSDPWPDVTVSVRQCRRLVMRRKPREWWVNVFHGGVNINATEERADEHGTGRLECIKVREVSVKDSKA